MGLYSPARPILPQDVTNAASQRLGSGFFYSKPPCKRRKSPVTFTLLRLGKNPREKFFTLTINYFTDTGNINKINTSGKFHTKNLRASR